MRNSKVKTNYKIKWFFVLYTLISQTTLSYLQLVSTIDKCILIN